MQFSRLLPGMTMLATATIVLFASDAFAREESTMVASWYGSRHQGLRTSSGDVFDQEGMTAASALIPLGSHVRVTMRDTGQSVVVLINDRMGARGAKIDLSRGAARQIGLLARGRGVVSVTSASDEPVEVAEAPDGDVSDAGEDAASIRSGAMGHHRHAARSPHRHRVHLSF